MDANEMLERTVGMALGTAIGDAKGIAYETLTREQIIELQKDNDKTLFTPVTNHPFIPEHWQIGRWTDDTQLTLAMMKALTKSLRHRQFDEHLMANIVDEHIIEWKESVAGWGGTKNAIERLANGTHVYTNSGNKAEGNGVLMKLAPLAFYYSLCGNVNDDEIEAVCRMTHDTPVALATACIYVRMCLYLFEKKNSNPTDFLQYLYQLSLQYENKYQLKEEKHLVSARIKRYFDVKVDEKLIIEVSNSGTFYCVDSLTMVIGLIASLPTCEPDFETLIRASEIGGDTDSNAAMIGAILGGMKGVKCLEQVHIHQVYRTDYVRKTGEELGLPMKEFLKSRT